MIVRDFSGLPFFIDNNFCLTYVESLFQALENFEISKIDKIKENASIYVINDPEKPLIRALSDPDNHRKIYAWWNPIKQNITGEDANKSIMNAFLDIADRDPKKTYALLPSSSDILDTIKTECNALRTFSKLTEESRKNLTGAAGKCTEKSKISKEAHCIWLSGKMYKGSDKTLVSDENILKSLEYLTIHKDHRLSLWTDDVHGMYEKVQHLQNEGKINNITLQRLDIKSYNEIFNENGDDQEIKHKLPGLINRELSGTMKNVHSAKDLLQMAILYQNGGIYFDMDTKWREKIPEMYAPLDIQLLAFRTDSKAKMTLGLMASLKGSNVIKEVIKTMIEYHEGKIEPLKKRPYLKGSQREKELSGPHPQTYDLMWKHKRSGEMRGSLTMEITYTLRDILFKNYGNLCLDVLPNALCGLARFAERNYLETSAKKSWENIQPLSRRSSDIGTKSR